MKNKQLLIDAQHSFATPSLPMDRTSAQGDATKLLDFVRKNNLYPVPTGHSDIDSVPLFSVEIFGPGFWKIPCEENDET